MKTSIVIPNYNGRKLLQKNLIQLIKVAPDSEIIVVDDASTDDSIKFLRQNYPKIKIIKHKKNQRFAKACNDGVQFANNNIVILLNSDVIPTKGFIEPLVKHFKKDYVFSVGCLEINAPFGTKANPNNVSGRTAGKFKRGLFVHWKPKDQQSIDTLWTSGGSMAVDRDKYLKLGGMDTLFSPAYWEDNDLCYRANKKGWKCLFEKDSVVYHYHETTNSAVFGNKNLEIISYRNQILFVWKNIKGRQLLEHFLWLPYHLVVTGVRSRGLFIVGLYQALIRWFKLK